MRDGLVKQLVDLNLSTFNHALRDGSICDPQLYRSEENDFYMIDIFMRYDWVKSIKEMMEKYYRKTNVNCLIRILTPADKIPALELVSEFTIPLKGIQMNDIKVEALNLLNKRNNEVSRL